MLQGSGRYNLNLSYSCTGKAIINQVITAISISYSLSAAMLPAVAIGTGGAGAAGAFFCTGFALG